MKNKTDLNKTIWLIDRLHWLWLILAAPFLLFPTPKRSLAMLVVPGIWMLHWMVRRRDKGTKANVVPVTPMNGAILLMMVMVLVSTWATYDIATSLPKISGMVLGMGVFFAVVREGGRARGWWLSLSLFLGFGVGTAGLGVFGTRWFSSKIVFFNPIIDRLPFLISGLQGAESGFHPNEVAGALTWVLPVMISLSIAGFLPYREWHRKDNETVIHPLKLKPWQRWIGRLGVWTSMLFAAGVFVLTQSRSAYIGLGMACLLLLFFALPSRRRLVSLGVILVVGIILGFTTSSNTILQIQEWFVGSGVTSENALSLNTLKGRVEVWSRAIYGLQDFPFTGMGMNTFRQVVHVLYPLFLISPDVDFGHAHNEFLQAGLDLGIPGLVAFLSLYLIAFWMLIDVRQRGKSIPQEKSNKLLGAIGLGLGGGLLAHLLYGLTDAVALGAKPGVIFWMLLGLIAGLHAQITKNAALIEAPIEGGADD